MTDEVVVLCTAGSGDEAARIAKALVDEHLAACVNVVSGVRSFFFWEGSVRDEQEVLLVCKSMQERVPMIVERVKALHSYSVPEIIALPIAAGSADYLQWVRDSVRDRS